MAQELVDTMPSSTAGTSAEAAEGMGRSTREQWESLPLHATADFLFDIICDGQSSTGSRR